MSIVYLKVKICSLAAEASIIRRFEGRWRHQWKVHQNPTFLGLKSHRTHDVRREQRAALLAYAYLRGRSYRAIEFKCHTPPDLERIVDLVRKYGPAASKDAVRLGTVEWITQSSAEKAA